MRKEELRHDPVRENIVKGVEYIKENDKTKESKPESFGKETKDEKTSVKEGIEESIKPESESPDE